MKVKQKTVLYFTPFRQNIFMRFFERIRHLPILTTIALLAVLIIPAFAVLLGTASAPAPAEPAPVPEVHVPTVYIETGHGTDDHDIWDPGCSWNGHQEAELMIPIAQAMADSLKRSGVTVYTDAYSDNNKNLEETLDFLEEHKDEIDAFVNIHCDYEYAEPGTMPLYKTKKQKKLARALNKGFHSKVDIADRGLTLRTDMKTLNNERVHCPAVLFETGSIAADFTVLTEHAEEYGQGLAKGMCKFLDIPWADK